MNNQNGLLNILISIVIPVLILNKLSLRLGPVNALILALAFPMGYGVWELWSRRKVNWISLLGLLNVAGTGGLAISGLGGLWFSIKEAFFPALMGVFVFASALTRRPFVSTLFANPNLMNWDLVSQRLRERGGEEDFQKHLKRSTQLLSGSFFVSALLNFVLAQRIFVSIDPSLDAAARSAALNGQIAQMTAYSAVAIMVPSMILLTLILWHLLRGIREITGLSLEAILNK